MANKLPGLTIGIAADVAQLRNDMNKAQREVKRGVDGMAKQARIARKALGSIASVLVGGAVVGRIISATREQEAAVKQLEQGLASTGNVVGQSLDELKRKAAELQKATTFGDEEIIRAQSQLVTFTKITGEQFDKTIELAADLSTRLDVDLKSSVLQLGKALNDPVANLSALSRAGIQFTESQKATVKSLIESNRLIDAQKIILAELETQFGGSARAARDTFGGALDGLGNAFGDLFEVSTGLDDAKESIEELTSLLQDPVTLEAVNNLVSGVIELVGWLTKAGVAGTNATRGLAEFFAAAGGSAGVKEAIKDLESLQKIGANIAGHAGLDNRAAGDARLIKGLIGFESLADLQVFLAQVQSNVESTYAKIGDGRNDAIDESYLQYWVQVRSYIEQAIAAKQDLAQPVAADSQDSAPDITVPVIDKAALAEQEKQISGVRSLLESLRPPLQVYSDSVAALDSLLAAGKLSQIDYNNALGEYQRRLADATGENEQWKKDLSDAAGLAESAKTELEKLNEQQARAQELFDQGLISPEVLKRTVAGIEEAREKLKESTDELSTFADEAKRNIQDALGDTVLKTLEGDFDSIGDLWADMLKRMAAEAIAADLASAFNLDGLFGSGGGGGSGGSTGGILSGLAGLFSFDGGGFTGTGARSGGLDGRGGFLAVMHPNETVVDHTKGQQLGGNTSININYTGTGNPQQDARAAGQMGRDIVSAMNNAQRYR